MKTDDKFVGTYIEYYSQDQTKEFHKYWEDKETPEQEISDLIKTDPDRAALLIDKIAKAASGVWKIQDQLNCGLIWDFKNYTGEDYLERIKKKK